MTLIGSLFKYLVTREVALLGRTRKCGFLERSVNLLEEVCHWEKALRFQKLKTDSVSVSVSVSLLPPLSSHPLPLSALEQDSSQRLPVHCLIPKPNPNKMPFKKISLGHGVSSQQ